MPYQSSIEDDVDRLPGTTDPPRAAAGRRRAATVQFPLGPVSDGPGSSAYRSSAYRSSAYRSSAYRASTSHGSSTLHAPSAALALAPGPPATREGPRRLFRLPRTRHAAAAGYVVPPTDLVAWAEEHTIEQVPLYVPGTTAPDRSVTAFYGVDGRNLFLIESSGIVRVRDERRATTATVEGVAKAHESRYGQRAWDPRFSPCSLVALVLYENGQAVMAPIRLGRELLRPPRPGPIWLRFFLNDSSPDANAGGFSLGIRRCAPPCSRPTD
jgi:hypothetical protein